MRSIVEAIVAATNLVCLVREETGSLELRRAAETTLQKLYTATDRITAMKEAERAENPRPTVP